MHTGSGAPPPLVTIDPPQPAALAPRVSVVMSVYNNAPYIAQAIDSVLSQNLDAPYEIIMADDFSSDGTRGILEHYKARFPTLIRLALARENTWGVASFREAIHASAAEYVALLDGDDFWTSRDKLRKQIAFLDGHRECSMCFHNVVAFVENERYDPFDFGPASANGYLTQRDLLARNSIVSCAPMIRTGILQALPDWVFELELGDWAIYVLAAASGPVGYLDEIMGAYRIHKEGSWSRLGLRGRLEGSIRFYDEMRRRLGDAYAPLIDRQRKTCCQELRTYAWAAWSGGDRPEALRAWASLADHDPQAFAAEMAHRFANRSDESADPHLDSTADPAYQGFQEPQYGVFLTGWAWDARRPDQPLSIEILDDDVVVATVVANSYRFDLEEAGKGRGYHAFSCRLPDALCDGRPHRIRTRIAGTGVFLANSGTIVAFADSRRPDDHVKTRNAQTEWLERDLEPRRAEMSALREKLVGSDTRIIELRRMLEATRSEIAALGSELAAKDHEAWRLSGDLDEARRTQNLLRHIEWLTGHLDLLTDQVKQLSSQTEQLSSQTEQLSSQAERLAHDLASAHAQRTGSETQMQNLVKQTDRLNVELASATHAVAALKQSWSWRITAPLRALAKLLLRMP
jgi:predicted  nucleic acid-binding Zn-ribbon protein